MDTRTHHWHGRFFRFPHKFWELCLTWEMPNNWKDYFRFDLSWTRNCDHAGFRFDFSLARLQIEFLIYDQRHWDYDTQQWSKHYRTDTEFDEWL
jgi:hypothetical protein